MDHRDSIPRPTAVSTGAVVGRLFRVGTSICGRELAALTIGWAVAVAALAPWIVTADAGQRGGPSLLLAGALLWWVAVVVVIRSDLRDYVIPDGASLTTGLLGVAVATLTPVVSGDGWSAAVSGANGALASALAAFGIFWAIQWLFARRGREALGFGDVKLAAALATWMAPAEAAVALELASLSAIVVLVARHRLRPRTALRETAVPFGAFMAPAAWLVVVLGPMARDLVGYPSW